MRRAGAFAAFLLAAIGVGAGFSGGNVRSDRVSVDRQLGFDGTSYHDFTRTEYLAPRMTPVKAAIAPTFDDGDTNFTTFYVAVADSIRNSLGRFGDSTFAGADLRGTTWIMPSLTTTPATGSKMSTAQVKALAGRSLYYEIGTHGPDSERLGSVGMDGGGNQVSYAGVTGMSREFLRAALGAYQDSAAAWGIPSFRSHGYGNWRMQHGMSDIWEEFGYFQCKSIAHPILQDQGDLSTETTTMQRNCDPFVPAAYGYGGPARYSGFHRIGEPFNPYDVGARSSWQYFSGNDNRSTDSLKVYTDLLTQHQVLGVVTFHQIVPDGVRGTVAGADSATAGLSIEEAEMYELMYFWASRVSEGLLDVLTFEQLVTRMRGVRDGNLIPHRNFMRVEQSRVSSPLAASIEEPMLFMPCINNQPQFYGDTKDTLVAPQTGAAGNWKVYDLGVTDTLSLAFTAYAAAGSTSYGTASKTGNVIIQEMPGPTTANSDGINLTIMTTGSDARYVYLAVQGIATNETTPNNWDTGTFYMGCKAGQFQEVWEDFVNSGPDAYASMADVIGWRIAPSFSTFNIEAQRVRPQFTFWYSDTTATAGTGALTLVTETASPASALTSTMAQFQRRGTGDLPFYSVFDRSVSWDLNRVSFGNFGAAGVAGNADEAALDNMYLVDTGAQVRNWVYQIPVNEHTDYVQVHLSLERNGTSLSSVGSFAILNLEAYPIR